MEQGSTFDLLELPEACISNILSFTTPRDACRSSVVSSVFRSAADSDSVWERFFPSDLYQILSSSVSPSLPSFPSKKELFLYLCNNPLLIDNGSKTFAVEKWSGKKCFMIGAKRLSIVWGDNPRFAIDLIHRDSPLTPLYNPQTTLWNRAEESYEISISHYDYLTSERSDRHRTDMIPDNFSFKT